MYKLYANQWAKPLRYIRTKRGWRTGQNICGRKMKGNWGKILKVDLTNGVFEDIELRKGLPRFPGRQRLAANDSLTMSADESFLRKIADVVGPSRPYRAGNLRLEICAAPPDQDGAKPAWEATSPQLKATGYDELLLRALKPVYLFVTMRAKTRTLLISGAGHL